MPQRMARSTLSHTRLRHGTGHRPLHDTRVQVMPPTLTTRTVAVDTPRWKYPLPRPLQCPAGRLTVQRSRQLHLPRTRRKVTVVQLPHAIQMFTQPPGSTGRKHRHSVLATLAPPDTDLATFEVQILYAQRQRLLQTEP